MAKVLCMTVAQVEWLLNKCGQNNRDKTGSHPSSVFQHGIERTEYRRYQRHTGQSIKNISKN